jgi:phenylacetate-CoA ligase
MSSAARAPAREVPRQTLRAWISKHLLYLPSQRLRGEPVLEHLAELERSQWQSTESLRARQREQALALVVHAAARIPHYRETWRAAGVDAGSLRTLDDLRRIPLLEKEVMRTSVQRLVAEATSARIDPRKTSGSTGIPMPILKSRDAYARIRAIWYRYARWYGIDIGDRQGRFLGHPVTWRGVLREDVQDFILNKFRLDPVYLTPDRMLAYWRKILRRPVVYLYGYASAMVAFARFLESRGEDPERAGIRTLVCTGETLYPFQEAYLREAYGCPVVNEYGCTESGVLAFPCAEAGRMHLSADNVLLEFLVGDRPAKPGEVGEVVLTDLYSPDAPLIRYRLGDMAIPTGDEPCPCGRGLPTIVRVEGRTSQMIRISDGREVHSEVFAYISDAMGEVDRTIEGFRVRRTGARAFMVQLVAQQALAPATLERLREIVARVLGADVALAIEQVSELPRDPSGKLRYFVSEEGSP